MQYEFPYCVVNSARSSRMAFQSLTPEAASHSGSLTANVFSQSKHPSTELSLISDVYRTSPRKRTTASPHRGSGGGWLLTDENGAVDDVKFALSLCPQSNHQGSSGYAGRCGDGYQALWALDAVLRTRSVPTVIPSELAGAAVFGLAGCVGTAGVQDNAPGFAVDLRPFFH